MRPSAGRRRPGTRTQPPARLAVAPRGWGWCLQRSPSSWSPHRVGIKRCSTCETKARHEHAAARAAPHCPAARGQHAGPVWGPYRAGQAELWVFVTLSSLLPCRVLECDPQFGFEEAKRKLEGRDAQGGLRWDLVRQGRWWPGGVTRVGGEDHCPRGAAADCHCVPRAALAGGLLRHLAPAPAGTCRRPDGPAAAPGTGPGRRDQPGCGVGGAAGRERRVGTGVGPGRQPGPGSVPRAPSLPHSRQSKWTVPCPVRTPAGTAG